MRWQILGNRASDAKGVVVIAHSMSPILYMGHRVKQLEAKVHTMSMSVGVCMLSVTCGTWQERRLMAVCTSQVENV